MQVKSSILFSCFIALAYAAYPNPLPGTSDVHIRDPSIVYNADLKTYYLFGTGKHLPYYSSKNLTGPYKRVGQVLPNCSSIDLPSSCMNWAPDVALVNGQYVLYYSLPHSGFQSYSAVGLATSPSMKPGTWEDHGLIQHGNDASDGGNDTFHTSTFFSIDANLIETPSGLTLTYGSYLGGIFQRNMSSVHDVADPSKMPGKHLAGGGNRPCEGAFVYHKNDWFYLFVSYGITIVDPNHPVAKNREYHVTVGRSKSVSGPFLDKNGTDMVKVANGTVVLKTHDNVYVPGGQSIFLDPVSKRDVMVYHYVPHSNLSAPTNLGINFLDFASGWPVLVE